MEDKNHIENENRDFEKEAPTLFNVPKKDVFKAPEGYFDSLHGRVLDKIDTKKQQRFKLRPAVYVPVAAAAVIAFIGIYLGLFSQQDVDTATVNDIFAEVATEFVDDIIIEDLINTTLIEDEEIIDAILADDGDLAFLDGPILAEMDFGDEAQITKNEEEIITYLVDFDISLDDIIDEYKTMEL